VRQQVLEFVLDTSAAPHIPLDRRAVEDVVKHMAAAIVAVYEEGVNESDDEPSIEQQDQE
jgi:hypothetical protein